MTGSSDFHIDPAPSFADSIGALKKATYRRTDTKGMAEFDEILERMLESLSDGRMWRE